MNYFMHSKVARLMKYTVYQAIRSQCIGFPLWNCDDSAN